MGKNYNKKNNNKESDKLLVLTKSHEIRHEFSELFYRNFGYKKRQVYKTYKDGSLKPEEVYLQECEEADREYRFICWELGKAANFMDDTLRELTKNIVSADAIYATNLAECDDRRLLQDHAIGCCFNIIQELQYILESKLFDIDKYTRYAKMLGEEINLLKSWRKSDNKLRNIIKAKNT